MKNIIIVESRPVVAGALADLLAEAGEVSVYRTLEDAEFAAAWAEEKPLIIVAPTVAIAQQARLNEISGHFCSIVTLVEGWCSRRLIDREICISLEADPDDLLSAIRIILSGARVQMTGEPTKNEGLLKSLTTREREILELLALGHTNRTIAGELEISAGTVAVHLRTIFGKLGIHNRTQAAALVHEHAAPTCQPLSIAA